MREKSLVSKSISHSILGICQGVVWMWNVPHRLKVWTRGSHLVVLLGRHVKTWGCKALREERDPWWQKLRIDSLVLLPVLCFLSVVWPASSPRGHHAFPSWLPPCTPSCDRHYCFWSRELKETIHPSVVFVKLFYCGNREGADASPLVHKMLNPVRRWELKRREQWGTQWGCDRSTRCGTVCWVKSIWTLTVAEI